MKATIWKAFSALALILLVGYARAQETQHQKPNVVFILADNVGYGDMGPYGGGELRSARIPSRWHILNLHSAPTEFVLHAKLMDVFISTGHGDDSDAHGDRSGRIYRQGQ